MRIIRNRIGIETMIYAKTLESEALDQIEKFINHAAYQNEKFRIMPDAHLGKGCTIGTTMTIKDKITPNMVGVDIGCGMLTIKLDDAEIPFSSMDRIIRSEIPSGFNIHKRPKERFDFSTLRSKEHVDIDRAKHSIGTLGGGNHFIEIGKSEKSGALYLIIHSGSRKLGSDICEYYQRKAVNALRSTGSLGGNFELAYLWGQDFDDYMNDMTIAQRYASLNRSTMAKIIMEEMGLAEESRFETIHNYIDFKHMILRKGAVSAQKGELLLIPINMRDGSLLCIGKGNADWNYSAPHGAGRLMSRNKAKKEIQMDEFIQSMQGVFTTSINKQTLDEAPQAYKSIDEIMAAITETVDIIDTIKPLYNFKSP